MSGISLSSTPVDYSLLVRLVSHDLAIETGRRNNIQRENRICSFCDSNEIESEHHFILRCDRFNFIRQRFIPEHFSQIPTQFNFCQLMKNKDISILYNLGRYLYHATNERKNILSLSV